MPDPRRRSGLIFALVASTALVAVPSALAPFGFGFGTVAVANGGLGGGTFSVKGSDGTNEQNKAGNKGTDGAKNGKDPVPYGSGTGGGGGGSGTKGGAGGAGYDWVPKNVPAGGAGGNYPGADGADGGSGTKGGYEAGGGGGGGAHGYVGSTGPANPVLGGMGGKGGNAGGASYNYSAGGGGGAGGTGAVLTGTGPFTIHYDATGGDGGAPGRQGTGHLDGYEGAYGDGGHGLSIVDTTGVTVTVGDGVTISGGLGGHDSSAGSGIVGQNLTLILSPTATIKAGQGRYSAAIIFGGAHNTLELIGNGGTSGQTYANIQGAVGSAFRTSVEDTRTLKFSGAGGVFNLNSLDSWGLTGRQFEYFNKVSVSSGSWIMSGVQVEDSNERSDWSIDGGTLQLDTVAGPTGINGGLTVKSGATLGVVAAVGAPGLTIAGKSLTLDAGSTLKVTLGAPSSVPLITIGSSFTYSGSLIIESNGSLNEGTYTLLTYGTQISGAGFTSVKAPSNFEYTFLLDTAKSSLLIDVERPGLYWNGKTAGGAPLGGGSGIWTAAAGGVQNWSDSNGTTQLVTDPTRKAVFAATAGTVTVDKELGAVQVRGLKFVSSGYILAGDTLTLSAASGVPKVDVIGDSTLATIAAPLAGTQGFRKTGSGTLVLTGTSTYTGGTEIAAGTLRVGAGGTSGSIAGDTANNGALAFDRSDSTTYAGLISGKGTLEKTGAGKLTLTGANIQTGSITVSGGTLVIGASGLSSSLDGDIGNNAALVFDISDALTYAGAISGKGTFEKTGAGTLTLTGAHTFPGAATVSGGTLLMIGNASLAGAVAVKSGGTLAGDPTGQPGGTITGSVTVHDGGTLRASWDGGYPALALQNGLALEAGSSMTVTLQQPSKSAAVSVAGDLALSGTLNVSAPGGVPTGLYRLFDYTGTLSGSHLTLGTTPSHALFAVDSTTTNAVDLAVVAGNWWQGTSGIPGSSGAAAGGSGIWNVNNYYLWTNATGAAINNWSQGGLAVFAGAAGTVTVDRGLAPEVAGIEFLTSGYTVTDGGLTLVGFYKDPITRILVDDGTTGGGDATIASALGGGQSLKKMGPGTLILTGANTYTGLTTVAAGTLQLSGGGSLAGDVDVKSGGTLGGDPAGQSAGRIAGAVTLRDGATLRANAGTTVAIGGDLTLNAASRVATTLMAPSATAAIGVAGTLTLAGTLNLAEKSFADGAYRLFDYAGALAGPGLTLGSLPAHSLFAVDAATKNQVNLFAKNGLWWNDTIGGGRVAGGSGTWDLAGSANHWTAADGSAATTWDKTGSMAIFAGKAGTVTVGATPPQVAGIEFGTSGYTLTGGAITLVGFHNDPLTRILVDDGSKDGGTATIAGALGGGQILRKTGPGTLILTGTNTYTGGTTVAAGTLQIGDGTVSGAVAGPIANAAALVFSPGAIGATYAEAISGSGSLTKAGANTLILSGTNTYTGGTTINAGTLQLGNGGISGSVTGTIANAATLVFDRSDDLVAGGAITGAGALLKRGAGTLTLAGSNSAGSGTTLAAGTLALASGVQLASVVTVQSGATLAGLATTGTSPTVTGTVTVQDGATLRVTATAGGNGLSTGGLILAHDAHLSVVLGAPTGHATVSTGSLALDGVLDVTGAGGLIRGVYRVIDYTTLVSDNGLRLGTTPASFTYEIQRQQGQVNLAVNDNGGSGGNSSGSGSGGASSGGSGSGSTGSSGGGSGSSGGAGSGGSGSGGTGISGGNSSGSGSSSGSGFSSGTSSGGTGSGGGNGSGSGSGSGSSGGGNGISGGNSSSGGSGTSGGGGAGPGLLYWNGTQTIADSTVHGGTGIWSADPTRTNWTDTPASQTLTY